ncbi:MAG: hypothetical protein CHACPFDD_00376 [Phycisphaerae bacterium]|nr:hypothetical protein [Phycisphaerae bacterium]
MRKVWQWGLVSIVAFAAASATAQDAKKPAGEMVDNPEYKHWSAFKPGSFSKLKLVGDMGGQKTETTLSQTLKEVTAEKAVVEIESVTVVNGQEMKMPPQKRDLPAKVAKGEADKQDNPEGKVGEGKEDVEAGGKKWACKWIQTEIKSGEMTTRAKVWTCQEVPGQVVKMTSETSGQVAMKNEGSLLEYKADKK